MDIKYKAKRLLLTSPLGKSAMNMQLAIQMLKIRIKSKPSNPQPTVYSLSPYKAGTTFLCYSFSPHLASHEPLHYFTLRKLSQNNFGTFFSMRNRYLNLKLECSGFWSAFIPELASCEHSRDLNYIFILRKPSAWVTSVLNYWNQPYFQSIDYECVNELFWKQKVGVDLLNTNLQDPLEVESTASTLLNFYFRITEESQMLKNVLYIKLEDLELRMKSVGELLAEKPNTRGSSKREAKTKQFHYSNKEVDQEYARLAENLSRNSLNHS